MKKLFLLLIVLKGWDAMAQQAVVANEKMNIAYAGVVNPLYALVAGYPCSSVTLTTDNGKIEKTGCGKFNYIPTKPGQTRIKIWIRNAGTSKLVGEWMYKVHLLPNPVAFLMITDNEGRMRSWSKDSLHKSFVRPTLSGIRAVLKETDYDSPFQIKSYSVKIKRDTAELYSDANIGSIITYQKIVPFNKLISGDHLIFYNIKCIGPDSIERIIAPLEFTIIE